MGLSTSRVVSKDILICKQKHPRLDLDNNYLSHDIL